MADRSKIEWTDATWTPIRARNRKTGKVGWFCEHASPGCQHCYSEAINARLGTGLPFKPGHRKDVEIFLDEKMLTQPLRWKKGRSIFVCSMTDLFADFVTDEMINYVLAIMALASQHTFQVLTKRAKRMRTYLANPNHLQRICDIAVMTKQANVEFQWPLPNVWLGVSVEDQTRADERREDFRSTPAAVKFVSYEPALGPVDWTGWEFVQQIISGGESGPKARPSHADWYRATRDFCEPHGIAYFHKQNGAWTSGENVDRQRGVVDVAWWVDDQWTFGRENLANEGGHIDDEPHVYRIGKRAAGRLLDGVEHNGMPGGVR